MDRQIESVTFKVILMYFRGARGKIRHSDKGPTEAQPISFVYFTSREC